MQRQIGSEKPRKPCHFIGGARRNLAALPEDVEDVFGRAFLDAQYGDLPDGARSFGEGLPSEIMKLVDDFEGNTYRAAYTVAFPKAVYVLDAFMKKSTTGSKTPQVDRHRVLARYKLAKNHYEDHYGDD